MTDFSTASACALPTRPSLRSEMPCSAASRAALRRPRSVFVTSASRTGSMFRSALAYRLVAGERRVSCYISRCADQHRRDSVPSTPRDKYSIARVEKRAAVPDLSSMNSSGVPDAAKARREQSVWPRGLCKVTLHVGRVRPRVWWRYSRIPIAVAVNANR